MHAAKRTKTLSKRQRKLLTDPGCVLYMVYQWHCHFIDGLSMALPSNPTNSNNKAKALLKAPNFASKTRDEVEPGCGKLGMSTCSLPPFKFGMSTDSVQNSWQQHQQH